MININAFTNPVLLKREKNFFFYKFFKITRCDRKKHNPKLREIKTYYPKQAVVNTAQIVKPTL